MLVVMAKLFFLATNQSVSYIAFANVPKNKYD